MNVNLIVPESTYPNIDQDNLCFRLYMYESPVELSCHSVKVVECCYKLWWSIVLIVDFSYNIIFFPPTIQYATVFAYRFMSLFFRQKYARTRNDGWDRSLPLESGTSLLRNNGLIWNCRNDRKLLDSCGDNQNEVSFSKFLNEIFR